MTSSKWAPADRGSAAYEDALRRCLAVYAVTDPRWLGGRRLCDVVEQAILGGAVPEGAPQPAQASVAGKSAARNALAQEK